MSLAGNVTSFDKEFDDYAHGTELSGNRTTANYRMVHLQRLANPLLPWNPEPKLADGKTANPDYKPNLPINPYRTVDSSSVNLTAFNGVSRKDSDIDPTKQQKENKMRPWIFGQDAANEVQLYINNLQAGKQVLYVRSLERGFSARLNQFGSIANPTTVLPQRVLWAQEPPMVILQSQRDQILDLTGLWTTPGMRQMTMRFDEVAPQAKTDQKIFKNLFDMVVEQSLGFGNESYGLMYDATPTGATPASKAPAASAVGAVAPDQLIFYHNVDPTTNTVNSSVPITSTNPWLEWGNRPYVSAEELLNVPAGSQATMLRMFSAGSSANPYDGTGFDAANAIVTNAVRWAGFRSPFGHLANFAATATTPADVDRDAMGVPKLDANGNVQAFGAPNFYRILDYVQVPSRYVGTDTMLNAETFNDVPTYVSASEPIGTDISSPADPRYNFQPPFNKVSRERDPGRVNLNTVTGRRIPPTATAAAQIWSEVFDGIMHRVHDNDPSSTTQLGHLGPAWRDIVISRRGYPQVNADGSGPIEKAGAVAAPDTFEFGLHKDFPSVFSNPFRSSDAGDLVPLANMVMSGVQASSLRSHHFNRGTDNVWGANNGDARAAGFGDDELVMKAGESGIPLLSASLGNPNVPAPWMDADRNPYMMYQPMSRLGNLVTNRSGVFAVWITVGYFEVEPAPKADPTLADWGNQALKDRCGGDISLYNRIYPDGYMLGRELGSDTGDVKRPRGFYIIDRTEEVGFKPGEDLNVEKLIRLRRRIE